MTQKRHNLQIKRTSMIKKTVALLFTSLTTLLSASDTCYSVQLLSSYTPLKRENFPQDAKVMHIGKIYTVRDGCYEQMKNASENLSLLKKSYPHAMIITTYKWRFHPKTIQKREEVLFKEKFNDKPKREANQKKCYSIQLQSSQNKLTNENFPYGTKIIQRRDFFTALYGCYTTINSLKSNLFTIEKKYPNAIIVLTDAQNFKTQEELPEIHKRGVPLQTPDIYRQKNITKLNRRPSFIKRVKESKKSPNQSPQCTPSIEQKLVSCRQKCKNNETQPWEEIDRDAVNQYVTNNLLKNLNIEGMQEQNIPFVSLHQESNNSFTSEGILHFYITTALFINKGQTDILNQQLTGESLHINPGLTYLYNFHPLWYFYTDDRVMYSITTSNTKLGFDVKNLYISSRNLFENRANILVGRKYINDKRGWYYKSSLDLLALSNKNDLLLYQFFIGTRVTKNRVAYDPNAVNKNLKGVQFFIGHISYEFFKENTLEGFYIYEDNKNAQKKLGWSGLRIQGKIAQKNSDILSYWGDIATMHGKYQKNNAQGLGYDIGVKYSLTRYASAIALSSAYGSGGGNLYLQPSFTNNRSNYLSKDISFRYYGEFLQPELSNMWISSLYLLHHFNNNPQTTAILAMHNYTQDKSSTTQYNATQFTLKPNGKKSDIGNEIDCILHYDIVQNSYWRFSAGYFIGGKAFEGKATKKDGFNAQVYFKYLW